MKKDEDDLYPLLSWLDDDINQEQATRKPNKERAIWDVMQKKLNPNDTRKQLSFCLFLLVVSFWFLLQTDIETHTTFFIPKYVPTEDSGFVVKTEVCAIPNLDPYDSSIKKYLSSEEDPLVCDKNNTGTLVKSNLTHLLIDWQVAYDNFFILDKKNLHCCFRPFWRIPHHLYDPHKFATDCIPFSNPVEVQNENVRVECKSSEKNELIYKDFFSFITKELVETAEDLTKNQNVSVLIIGIDGLSRLNFHRQMPKTYKFLTENTNLVEFLGYNKVGDNTFPNLIPVLSGVFDSELSKICWPHSSLPFDNCSFIWKDFKKSGYVTAFGEDASWMGLFEYQKPGFKDKPTDFYLRTFNKVSEEEIGHEMRLNANMCLGARMNVEVMLDVIEKFGTLLQKKKSFGFFWENSLSHDFLNTPRYGDKGHFEMLKRFGKEGLFERSVVIVMSDHGIRWGGIKETWQGFMEERLPLLLMTYPRWFSHKFPQAVANLKRNQRYLVTPFDLHQTLKDLLNLNNVEDDVIKKRYNLTSNQRGISLFLPVSKERTCADAGIEDHWCTCHQSLEIPKNKPIVKRVSSFVINYINSLLTGYKQCSKLEIKTILNARQQVLLSKKENISENKEDIESTLVDYVIRIQTKPGDGIFEATVRQHQSNNKLTVLGTVTRSNQYGDQSKCVSHYKLKLYCYCMPEVF